MEPISLIIILVGITLAGTLVGLGVHFVPVGGAPAAMAQATGIGTGTTMLAAASGFLGLISAGFTVHDLSSGGVLAKEFPDMYGKFGQYVQPGNPNYGNLFNTAGNITDNLAAIVLIIAAGVVGAMLMMVLLAVVANVLYAFAIAVPLVSAKVKYDPITGKRQDLYVTKGTEGHGTPTVAVVSSLIGGALGGAGGAIIYLVLVAGEFSVATAAFAAIGVFFVNSVLASYNITGTIEGFHDPKFKRWPRAVIACSVVSFAVGILAVGIVALQAGVV